jgi:predicted adenylyl cyclase CyaB
MIVSCEDMKRNVEIKARARDLEDLAERAKAIADGSPTVIYQEDTFFHSQKGRLKLRKFSDTNGELIFYERPNSVEPTECRYSLSTTSTPDKLKDILSQALGVRGTVKKQRTLYMAGQTRIHIDDVDEIGRFVELEVVLEPDQSETDGIQIAHELMEELGIPKEDLIDVAYIDMLDDRPGR